MSDAARWAALSAALDDLLDLAPAEREAALTRHAARDPQFARELRELLAAEADTGLLEDGVAAAAPEVLQRIVAQGDENQPADETGRSVAQWRLLREIGRGGMGQVWLAERTLGDFVQQAALKRLKRGMDSDELLRRFAQERRILATLSHPHIARLLDSGLDAQGRPYYAMEYVEGSPIIDSARSRQLSLRDRIVLLLKVCDAVAYAQGRLVVHRDLKPSNILVDVRGDPHLLDFGIAKLLDDSGPPDMTRTGVRVLSPAYAAPEQILGAPISTATDVYALGVLLFELLVGQLPHRRQAAAPEAMAEALSHESTERPSLALRRESVESAERAWGQRARERERLAREIHGDLDRIVLTALRREPERRYASAAALADDLRRFLDGRPIRARADTAGYRLRKFVQRHRAGAVATVLVLCSLVGGLAAALWQAREAQAQAARAAAQAHRAELVKDFMVSLIEESNPVRAREGAQMRVGELVRDAARRLDTELVDAPAARAELNVVVGDSLMAHGETGPGLARIEAGIAALRSSEEAAPAVLAYSLGRLAIAYGLLGRSDEALRAAEEGLAILDGLEDADPLVRIRLRTSIVKQASMHHDVATIEAQYRAILADRRALLGADSFELAVDWNNLAAVLLRRDRYREAADAYDEAMRVLATNPESPESRLAWLLAGRGAALMGLGEYAAAEDDLLRAREIAERTLSPTHHIVATICHLRSAVLRYQGRLAESEANARHAVALFAPLNHGDQGSAELQLGLILVESRRFDEAAEVLDAALLHNEQRRSRRDPHFWTTRALRALVARRLGDRDAGAALDAALAGFREHGLEGGSGYADSLLKRAQVAALDGDAAAARRWHAEALAALRSLLGPDHPRVRAAQAAPP